MSVRCLLYIVPIPCNFFAWTGAKRPTSVDWCGAFLALVWSPKNRKVFQIGRDSPPLPATAAMVATATTTAAGGNGGKFLFWQKKVMLSAPFFDASGNKKNWCYSPHPSDWVSYVCKIFFPPRIHM